MSDNVSTLPDASIVLDLDTAERDPKDVKPPFKVKVEGRVVTFQDPNDIPWQDLQGLETPGDLFSIALDPDDRRYIRGLRLETWRFHKLMDAYFVHFDFEEKMREARRQAAQFG